MKSISLLSSHPGSGQITVLLNLAAGLGRNNNRVLIYDIGQHFKTYYWLRMNPFNGSWAEINPLALSDFIYHSSLGIDLLSLPSNPEANFFIDNYAQTIKKLNYDYLLLNISSCEDLSLGINLADYILACTDLKADDEAQDLLNLQKEISQINNTKAIDRVVPCRIEAGEWDKNSNKLFAIGEMLGYEKLLDLLPT